MLFITILLITIPFFSVIMLLVSWLTHIDMTKGDSSKQGWANYKTFKEYFNRYEWEDSDIFKGSYWNRKLDCKYHASIIKFEGVGMLINNPINYLLVNNYVRKYPPKKKIFDFNSDFVSKNNYNKKGYNIDIGDGSKIFVSMEEIYGEKID